MSGKKLLNFMNKRMLILTIFLGAVLVGYTTGIVIAQEVKIGDTSGTPFISFNDAMDSGMYEIRLNDGTGQFQIWDITNSRSVFIIGSNGNVGVGDLAATDQDFVIGCSTGVCNIKTIANNGTAANTVVSVGETGAAKFRIQDDTNAGTIVFEIKSQNNGTFCFGTPSNPCMLIFDLKGPNPGQVRQTDGTCIANC